MKLVCFIYIVRNKNTFQIIYLFLTLFTTNQQSIACTMTLTLPLYPM